MKPDSVFSGKNRQMVSGCGFTLIEVLVAISVTAIIGVGAALTLQSGVKTKQAIEARSAVLEAIQKFERIVTADLSQIVSRTARNEYGDHLYACTNLDALSLLEFSRTGWRDPMSLMALINPDLELKPRSNLQRVVYELEGDVLYRYFWRVMDRSQDSEPVRQRVLGQIISLDLRFLDENNAWSEQWPSVDILNNEDIDPFPIVPKAIEMTIVHEVFGEFSKLYLLAGWNTHTLKVTASENVNSPDGRAQQQQPGTNKGNQPGQLQSKGSSPTGFSNQGFGSDEDEDAGGG